MVNWCEMIKNMFENVTCISKLNFEIITKICGILTFSIDNRSNDTYDNDILI